MQIKILLGVRLGNVTFWMQTKEIKPLVIISTQDIDSCK